jgi:transcription factor C subunit 6
MARSLRPRKEPKNYAAMVDIGDANDDNTSIPAVEVLEVDASSGSDFEMADAGNEHEDHNDDENLSGDELSMEFEDPDAASDEESHQKRKGKGKATGNRTTKTLPKANARPGRLRPATRQSFSLPNPTVHHRHRPMPLFDRSGNVEQLLEEPVMFRPPSITTTNGFTSSKLTRDRLSKAWGFNVGSGPLWELLEDRGWYKETCRVTSSSPEPEKEALRRPHVYQNVRLKDGWKILTKEFVFFNHFRENK